MWVSCLFVFFLSNRAEFIEIRNNVTEYVIHRGLK